MVVATIVNPYKVRGGIWRVKVLYFVYFFFLRSKKRPLLRNFHQQNGIAERQVSASPNIFELTPVSRRKMTYDWPLKYNKALMHAKKYFFPSESFCQRKKWFWTKETFDGFACWQLRRAKLLTPPWALHCQTMNLDFLGQAFLFILFS